MDRRDIALRRIDITKGRGLELGPLVSPLVSKEEAKIFYVDHLSTEDLRKKYKGHPFAPGDIAPVDYVLKNSLRETLRGKKFDYVLASHVIEHIPDIVTWLADVASILENDGILSLVIPDKQFTFDILRNESRPADVIGAYLDKYTKASSVTMYDYVSNVRDINAQEVWRKPYQDYSKRPKNSPKKAYDTCLENLKPDKYVDSHCFVFTPYSFFEIVRALIAHDLFDYEIAYFENTPENQLEFYVSLRKAKGATRARKLRNIPKLPKPTASHELHQEILRLKAEKSQLETRITKLEAELTGVTTSKSWKLTKPLRRTSKVTKKIHQSRSRHEASE